MINKKNVKKILFILSLVMVFLYYKNINQYTLLMQKSFRIICLFIFIIIVVITISDSKIKLRVISTFTTVAAISIVMLLLLNHLSSQGYKISESYDPWNNIYLEIENSTGAELVKKDEIEEKNLIYNHIEKRFSQEIYDYYGFDRDGAYLVIYDDIEQNNEKYYMVKIFRNNDEYSYGIAKENSDGDVSFTELEIKDINNENLTALFVEGNEDDKIYFYMTECFMVCTNDVEPVYNFYSINNSMNLSSEFTINSFEIRDAIIHRDSIYTIVKNSSAKNTMIKYDLQGNVLLEKNIDANHADFNSMDIAIYPYEDYIGIYGFYYNNSEKLASYLKLYDLDLKMDSLIVFEPIDTKFLREVNISVEDKFYGKFKYDLNFMTYDSREVYIQSIDLKPSDNAILYNIKTSEIVIDNYGGEKSSYFSSNYHSNLSFTVMTIVFYAIILVNICITFVTPKEK